eukprot:m.1639656 g.1639656  ORF g.1639656 m.1639656 type:complete len:53 (+) comp37184_c0_seq1:67-225(+)
MVVLNLSHQEMVGTIWQTRRQPAQMQNKHEGNGNLKYTLNNGLKKNLCALTI